jgi:hypothetical protein
MAAVLISGRGPEIGIMTGDWGGSIALREMQPTNYRGNLGGAWARRVMKIPCLPRSATGRLDAASLPRRRPAAFFRDDESWSKSLTVLPCQRDLMLTLDIALKILPHTRLTSPPSPTKRIIEQILGRNQPRPWRLMIDTSAAPLASLWHRISFYDGTCGL